MFKLNLIKDLKLMAKELKFKLLSAIILLLFILSGIASVFSYENRVQEFNNSYLSQKGIDESVLDRVDRVLSHNVSYYQVPSKYNLICEKTGFPNSLTTKVVAENISAQSFENHSNSYFVLNWLFIIGVICSFSALIFSFNGISSEKKTGTLKLKLIAGLTKHKILYSKYLANMIFFSVTILLGMILSILVATLFNSDFISNLNVVEFLVIIVAILLISMLYLSIFIWTGLFLSLLKNERNGVIMALTCWLLVIVIIPNLVWIIGKNIILVENMQEYQLKGQEAWNSEYSIWTGKYDNPETMVNKVGGNGYLEEGYRSGAVQASDEKKSQAQKKIGKEHLAQIEFLERLSFISPYSQLDKIYQIIVEQGLSRLKVEMQSLAKHRQKVESILKEIDDSDEASLHLWYSWAGHDSNSNIPFSQKPYTAKDDFILTSYSSLNHFKKINEVLPILIIMLITNCIWVVITLVKLKKYDVR